MEQVTLSATDTPTRDPEITVMNKLPVGAYKVRLVVEDDSGNRSEPVEAQIVVRRLA